MPKCEWKEEMGGGVQAADAAAGEKSEDKTPRRSQTREAQREEEAEAGVASDVVEPKERKSLDLQDYGKETLAL